MMESSAFVISQVRLTHTVNARVPAASSWAHSSAEPPSAFAALLPLAEVQLAFAAAPAAASAGLGVAAGTRAQAPVALVAVSSSVQARLVVAAELEASPAAERVVVYKWRPAVVDEAAAAV